MSESEYGEAELPLNKQRRAFGAVESHYPLRDLAGWFRTILGPEQRYFWLAVIYGIAISGLTLAVPLAVQMLIDSVANTALVRPLVVLSLLLFGLLAISGVLSALRTYLMELYGRRVHARLMADFSLRAVYARTPFFENRKRDVLFDRYFDIMTLQRNVPELLLGAFAIFLQSVMGFIVVSLYHPVFLGFNLVLIVLIYLVWRIWGPAAVRTGIDLSDAKYEAAAWLDHLGSANSLYKSRTHIEYALARSETLTSRYIEQEKRHFRRTFAQTIALLFLYALASSLLLGLGGWLVIRGELSLGQLVAAELIMSAIFVGMSQFDSYLRRFYYVCMAVAEISELHEIPLERADGERLSDDGSFELRFRDVHRTTRSREANLNFTIPEGETVRVDAEEEVLQRMVTSMLERNEAPEHGYIMVGEVDIATCDLHRLRQYLMVERRPMIMDGSIADYLVLSGADRASRGEMFEMLRLVGIEEVVRELDEGLDTVLSPIGLPLSTEEVLRLKLAAALLACPRILVVGEVFGLVDRDVDAARDRVATAVRDAERQQLLFEEGLASRLEMENARIQLEELRSQVATAEAQLQRIEVDLARQSARTVRAPQAGTILGVTSGDRATVIAQGQRVASFVPSGGERAVRLYLGGRDAALVEPGRNVRLQFEGWPSVQFSGWPSVAVGTFGGRVAVVDRSANAQGQFQVLVVPDPQEPPWPEDRFVRLGTKARGWVQLETVRLGFELWRQMNNFPPEFQVRGGNGEAGGTTNAGR